MTLGVATAVFFTQALAMAVDEFVFHRRRGLPSWERRGHPLDTLSVLLCLGLALTAPAQGFWLRLYALAAIFSCLCVTKDEWVHAGRCTPAEHWLHAGLFMLHPILLFAVYALWRNGGETGRGLLALESVLAAVFAGYQWLYWNTAWLPARHR